jgi:hypothetical protein
LNVAITFRPDGTYDLGYGDDWNGFEERTEVRSWDQALRWFRTTAARHIRTDVERSEAGGSP